VRRRAAHRPAVIPALRRRLSAIALVGGRQADWSIRKGGLWWLSARAREGEKQVVVRAVIGPDLL